MELRASRGASDLEAFVVTNSDASPAAAAGAPAPEPPLVPKALPPVPGRVRRSISIRAASASTSSKSTARRGRVGQSASAKPGLHNATEGSEAPKVRSTASKASLRKTSSRSTAAPRPPRRSARDSAACASSSIPELNEERGERPAARAQPKRRGGREPGPFIVAELSEHTASVVDSGALSEIEEVPRLKSEELSLSSSSSMSSAAGASCSPP